MSLNANLARIEEADRTLKPTMFVQHTLRPACQFSTSKEALLRPTAAVESLQSALRGVCEGTVVMQQPAPAHAHLQPCHQKEEDWDNAPKLIVDEIQQLDEAMAFRDYIQDFDKELAQLCGTSRSARPEACDSHRSAEFSLRRWLNDVKAFGNPPIQDSAMTSDSSLTMIDSDTPGLTVYNRGPVASRDAHLEPHTLVARRSSACVPVPAGHLRRASAEQPISEAIRQRVMARSNSTPGIQSARLYIGARNFRRDEIISASVKGSQGGALIPAQISRPYLVQPARNPLEG